MSETTRQQGTQPQRAAGAVRLQTRLQWDQIARSERPAQLKVALLATFTANPLVPYLGVALEQQGLPIDVWVGPYNQIVPQCLDENSELAHSALDVLLIWPRLEELWGAQPLPLTDAPADYVDSAVEMAEICLAAARRNGATLLFVLPAIPEVRPLGLGDAGNGLGVVAMATAAREALRRHLAQQPEVLLLDAEEIVRSLGSTQSYNHRMQAVARIPFTEEVFWSAGQGIARLLMLQRQPRHQVVVIDPDNVLWAGKLSEQGPLGVDLHEGGPGELCRQVQTFLLELRRAGVQLALCGDYAEQDLWETMARREMRLRRENLAGWQIGAAALAQALPDLAAQLGVAVDALVMISSDAAALHELQSALPAIASIAMPEELSEWMDTLQGSGLLDQLPPAAPLAAEPAVPTNGTSQSSEPARGLEGFLARLKLTVEVFPAEAQHVAHIAHLTEHTSEFALTGVQRTPDEVAAFLQRQDAEGWLVEVRDRLGDYGLAGTILFTQEQTMLVVDTLLLNCRVLGRNVEYIVLNRLGEIAQERGCTAVRLVHRRTARNAVAGAFVQAVGGAAVQPTDDGFSVTLPVAAAMTATANDQPPSSCAIAPSPAQATPTTPAAIAFLHRRWRNIAAPEKSRLLTQIASDFHSGAAILEAVRNHRRRARPSLTEEYVAPRTPLEAQLSEVWARVLGVERVGVQDNFFHLGGHSILATQLVIQLYEAIGVELPIRIFFETPTVESMAQAIDIIRRTGDDSAFTAEAPSYIKSETVLDPAIVPDGVRPAEYTTDPRTILLTGASGFLGAFLLHDLLRQTQAEIACLVRAQDAAEGQARIRENLAQYDLWDAAFDQRVVPVVGDLAQPLLGLSEARFQELAATIDVIYHAGAITSFIYPYSTLKPSNVLGTQEVLRLACRERIKPVHFTSTLYVFAPSDRPEGRDILEEDIPEHVDTMHVGYRQSKWVAERLVMIARERGLPVSIYRPSRIAGHSQTGACQTNDFVWRMIKACLEVNSVMTQNMMMDMVPVDYVSQAVVALSQRPDAVGKVFHLCSPEPPYLDDIVAWVRTYGYPLQRETYDEWRGRLKEAAGHNRESAAYALIAFLPEILDEKLLADLPFEQRNTQTGLAGTSVVCPQIDAAMFHMYLDYFTQSGFIQAPPVSVAC